MARDSYSVMHFFLILGIIFAALGFKKTLGDYDYPLKEIPAFALCTGLAMYVATLSALRKRNVGSFNWYRLVAAAALLALYPVAREIDSKYTLLSAFGILLALILIENWRYKEVRERYPRGSGGDRGALSARGSARVGLLPTAGTSPSARPDVAALLGRRRRKPLPLAVDSCSSQAFELSAKQRSSVSSSWSCSASFSTGVTSSTRLSRLRRIRSAEPISTTRSSPRRKA